MSKRPGIASQYIEGISAIQHGDRVVLYVRVSGPSQCPRRQLCELRRVLKRLGAIIVGEVIVRCSGYDCSSGEQSTWATSTWAKSLKRAATLACKLNAKIVAT